MFVGSQEVRMASEFRIPLTRAPSGLIYRAMGACGHCWRGSY